MSVSARWPLVGSAFTDMDKCDPIIPAVRRPKGTQVSDTEREILLDGHWLPYDNSHLAVAAGYRLRPPPITVSSSSTSSTIRPSSFATVVARPKKAVQADVRSLPPAKTVDHKHYFSKAVHSITKAMNAAQKTNRRRVPVTRRPNSVADRTDPSSVTIMQPPCVPNPAQDAVVG